MTFPDKEVLDRIRQNGSQVRAAATELTERIKKFEAWLSKLPGRVSADCVTYSDLERHVDTFLAYRKCGKDWALVVYDYYEEFQREGQETLLRDAPIEIKVMMVSFFPKLVEAFAKRQEEVAKLARESSRDFDVIAKGLGIQEGA